MTSTHDLPTVAGWWQGRDIVERANAGRLGVGVSEADVAAERARDRRALWQAFVQAEVAAGDPPAESLSEPVVDAALAFTAATPAPLCLLPLEDLIGAPDQPNLPGTIDQHPNWRRRVGQEVGTLFDEPCVARRMAQLAQRRPRL
jgi:4-alpha-glucanotransferase